MMSPFAHITGIEFYISKLNALNIIMYLIISDVHLCKCATFIPNVDEYILSILYTYSLSYSLESNIKINLKPNQFFKHKKKIPSAE